MAALPANNTNRFWLAYNDGFNDHEMLVRFTDTPSLETVMGEVDAFIATLDEQLYEITVTGARYAGEGSDISAPIIWTGAATYGTGAMPAVDRPREGGFLGRTAQGRRFRVFLYGLKVTTPDNYRFPSAGGNSVELAITQLISSQALGVFVAIDNLAPTMYQYMNIQFNSYWEYQSRG